MPQHPYAASPRAVLPIEPTPYHSFWRAPSYAWWRGLVALVVFFVGWFAVTMIIGVAWLLLQLLLNPGSLEMLFSGSISNFRMTPGLFLMNNLTIVAMIPAAYLTQWLLVGQRPRWLSSVVGRLRWRWLGSCLAVAAVPYLAVTGARIGLGRLPDLEWKPYTVFMIATVLLTTPLQSAGEEVGVRGLVNRAVASWFRDSRLGWWLAAVASSLVFASLHLAQDLFLNFFYISFGMLACWLVRMTGGLEASIAWHVVNNLSAMWVLPFVDFSHLMDRSAGAVGLGDAVETVATLALAPLALWLLARWRRPVTQGPLVETSPNPAEISPGPVAG